ncbi:MAG: hypothetical protein RLZZ271_693 [Pseudomonadota bacterium]
MYIGRNCNEIDGGFRDFTYEWSFTQFIRVDPNCMRLSVVSVVVMQTFLRDTLQNQG